MNKTIRRLMAIMFAGTLCVSLLAGCGKAAAPEDMEPLEEYYDDEYIEDEEMEDEAYEDEEIVEDYDEEAEAPDGNDTEAADSETAEASAAEAKTSDSEGDAGEGTAIADGEYVTDDEYTGELSADGKTMTITTALSEFVNSPSPTYPKQTYVINVADSCKCVQIQDETKETSFFDSMDLIKDFLSGKSGLPITLVFKNNELVEIQFSS